MSLPKELNNLQKRPGRFLNFRRAHLEMLKDNPAVRTTGWKLSCWWVLIRTLWGLNRVHSSLRADEAAPGDRSRSIALLLRLYDLAELCPDMLAGPYRHSAVLGSIVNHP